jgi:hypothetical protein
MVLFQTACSSEDVIQHFLTEGENFRETNSTSTEAPVFLGYKAVSPTEIRFEFSLPVQVVSLNFDPPAQIASVKEGDTVTVTLSGAMVGGERFVADLLVEDERRNSLNVLIPFRARNERIPEVLITELRTELSKLKVEFVELKTMGAGNLGALRLFVATNSLETPIYEFPPVEVAEGEYLVVHLRSAEAGVVNELGDDLGQSGGTETNPDSRDFWVPESAERFRKTDAVYLLDQDDRILDAVLLSELTDVWWAKESLAAAAEFLHEQGAWIPGDPPAGSEAVPSGGSNGTVPGPAAAVDSSKTTNTRSICRDETTPDSNSAADWYITVASGVTPGRPNNPNRFTAK